uniref:Uncharacterized protein n=1 Tax=Eutreptiella gymnastica TaxID=73025 RepID=A0A7S1IZG1_9EUGL
MGPGGQVANLSQQISDLVMRLEVLEAFHASLPRPNPTPAVLCFVPPGSALAPHPKPTAEHLQQCECSARSSQRGFPHGVLHGIIYSVVGPQIPPPVSGN